MYSQNFYDEYYALNDFKTNISALHGETGHFPLEITKDHYVKILNESIIAKLSDFTDISIA
jgi:hypothetical protein